MRSDDTWKAANRYSADRMIACSVIVFAMQLLSLAVFGPAISLPVAAAAIMSGMTWVIISTERYLKRTFDDAGEKRH